MPDLSDLSTPATRALDELGIPYQYFRHPRPVTSLEQAAQERGQRPEQIVRSILFRLSDQQYIMVLVAGPYQLAWPRLRQYLGASRMSMASPEQVLETTGYPTGAVSPFGLPNPIRVLLDESILAERELSIGSGVRNTTILIRRDDLLRALGKVETGQFVE